ncbi:hypothetical protein F5148DRAFT_458139 [Russula earlei]|uniref:Uncharacterized protein n=1 Tax=Russula earlei TaxID=71964 RepID=A0ACC0TZ52_9AGAM|nr:hypothetical protein F5148DRAFT_458139 [Russula earlei]
MERHGNVFLGWRVPCLGLTIVGKLNISWSSYESDMGYEAHMIIYLDLWRIVSLTPGLSCISSACERNDRKRLCAAFSGALVLLRRIDDDASRFIEHGHPRFPYISISPRFDATGESQFRILRRHPDTQE